MHKQGFPAVAALLVAAGCVTGPNEAARGEADLRSAAIVLYVHPGGDDANPGTIDAPFATMERARDALRKLRRNGQASAGPRVVQLHGGTYRLTRPLVLTPQDSGTADAPVVYQAAPGERVVISGGRKVTGWLRHDDRLWVAEAPWSGEREQPLTQLFVNNRRRTRARTPNPGTYFYTKHLKRDSGHGGLCRGMTFVQGDIERWPGFEDNARIVLYHNWVNSVNAIGEVDWDRRRIRFHRPAGVFFLGPNVRYYVENVRAALDAPGEWFFDHAAGKLYYYPKPDEDLVDAEVVVSVVPRTLISVQGDQSLGLYVEHVTFRCLSFQHTDADLSPDYRHGVQGAPHQRGVITATAFRHGVVENCEFAHIGEHAVSLLEGCADNTVRQCHIHDMGGGGVYLSEGKGAGKDESDMTVRTLVEDNFIHDGGHCFAAGCGVFLGGRASYNRILHNEVCDMSWMGVHAGWSWTGKAPTQTHHNEIAYNHLHHLGNGVLCDIGGIYTLGVSPGTVLHHNLIHDITRFERGKQGYGGWGIYLDAGSSEIRVENNVVYNTRDGGFHSHMDNWPYGCMLRNNVFAYSQTAQMMRNNKDEPEGLHLHIERNIIYNRNPKMYGGHNWNKDGHFTCERNCYWSEEGGELDFKGRSFAEWQSEGRDTDSIIADPRFVAPEKGDFRLRRKSPALVLGFQHIDLSDVGVRRPKALKRLTKNVTHRAYETAPPLPEPWPLHFDFEEYDAGEKPAGAIDEDGGARVTITDAVAGAGQQCMRFEDAPNVTDWKPHWYSYFKPRPDTLRMQCRFRNEPAEPATITFEFRDWPKGEPLRTGAYLKINPDGRAQAPDGADGWIDLGTCPPGEWITVDITLDQQADSAGTWAVQLTGPDGPIGSKTGLPCSNADFRRANWFGIVGADTKRALFHIDDVHLE